MRMVPGNEMSVSDDPVAAWLTTGRKGDEDRSKVRAEMSQHTLVPMLERYRMLMAKVSAKEGWRNVTGVRVVSFRDLFCCRSVVSHPSNQHYLTRGCKPRRRPRFDKRLETNRNVIADNQNHTSVVMYAEVKKTIGVTPKTRYSS